MSSAVKSPDSPCLQYCHPDATWSDSTYDLREAEGPPEKAFVHFAFFGRPHRDAPVGSREQPAVPNGHPTRTYLT